MCALRPLVDASRRVSRRPIASPRWAVYATVYHGAGRVPTRTMFDLDDTQQRVRELYLKKRNVGIFGRAGCGKSTVIVRAIQHARRIYGDKKVGVLAWTNHAAGLIGGRTVHKLLGVGTAALPKERVLEIVKGNPATRYRLQHVRVIFIDELPIIAARWFLVLEYFVRLLAPPSMQAVPRGSCQVVGTFP